MELSPMIFSPRLLSKVWGGRRLERFGKALPADAAIGESWELYDRPDSSATVASGPLAGQTLNALLKEFGPRLVGQAEYEKGAAYFPLMIKLIDANDSLSVQVHPDDEQALRMVGPDELGKTEMWVVLAAEPGSKMTAGLKPGTDKAAFQAALKAGTLESVLNAFEVKAGDVIFVPAGRVHAIGRGCLVAEVQQNSDTTYRVYDYNRLENGKPRELHVSQALDCIRFDGAMAAMPALCELRPGQRGETRLVECEYFKVSRIDLEDSSFSPASGGGSYHILSVLTGGLTLSSAGLQQELSAGQTALVPAACDWSLRGTASLLWSRP